MLESAAVGHPSALGEEDVRIVVVPRPGETPDPLELVSRYAAAKSRRDIESALAVCSDDFVLDTVPFGTRAVGTAMVPERGAARLDRGAQNGLDCFDQAYRTVGRQAG